jgi:hypothetical protein
MTYRENNIEDEPVQTVHIIACGVFRPALEQLNFEERFPGLHVTYLASNLHINPHELKKYLLKEIIASQKNNERIVCLYGECFPDIDILCKQYGVMKMEGHHCYEIFLGSGKFRGIMDESAKTYFLEKDLILNFEEYCVKPLELHDGEMKELFFKNYERLVYVRQPSDPDLIPIVNKIADFLGLSIIVCDADYSNFEKALIDLIDSDNN